MRTSFTIIGYNSNFNTKFSFFVLSQNFFTLSLIKIDLKLDMQLTLYKIKFDNTYQIELLQS